MLLKTQPFIHKTYIYLYICRLISFLPLMLVVGSAMKQEISSIRNATQDPAFYTQILYIYIYIYMYVYIYMYMYIFVDLFLSYLSCWFLVVRWSKKYLRSEMLLKTQPFINKSYIYIYIYIYIYVYICRLISFLPLMLVFGSAMKQEISSIWNATQDPAFYKQILYIYIYVCIYMYIYIYIFVDLFLSYLSCWFFVVRWSRKYLRSEMLLKRPAFYTQIFPLSRVSFAIIFLRTAQSLMSNKVCFPYHKP